MADPKKPPRTLDDILAEVQGPPAVKPAPSLDDILAQVKPSPVEKASTAPSDWSDQFGTEAGGILKLARSAVQSVTAGAGNAKRYIEDLKNPGGVKRAAIGLAEGVADPFLKVAPLVSEGLGGGGLSDPAATLARNVRQNMTGDSLDREIAGEEAATGSIHQKIVDALKAVPAIAATVAAGPIDGAVERKVAGSVGENLVGRLLARTAGASAAGATFGAASDLNNPIEGATTGALIAPVLGEATRAVVHGPTAAAASLFDVSRGALEVGVKDMATEVGSDQMHTKTGMSPTRRTGGRIPMQYRPPVEPAADAEGVSVGDTPLERLTDPQVALRARLAEDLGVKKEAIGEIGRRVQQLPDPAAEPAPALPAPVEPAADAVARSFPIEDSGLKPVASANGEFSVRPSVMRRVNAGNLAADSPLRLPPAPTPEDLAVAQPEGVKRISPEEVAARAPAETPPAPVARGRKAPDMFDSARTPGGDLRPFNRVSDDGLIRELTDYQARIADAEQRSLYNWTQDDNFHSTEDGRKVVSATYPKGGGASMQAKALQNLSDYSRIMKEIDGELMKRGHTSDSIYERQQHLSELDAAVERDALTQQDSEEGINFDFGDEAAPKVGGAGGAEVEPGTPAPVGEPRNVPADQLIDRSTLDTDPSGSQELDRELANLKAQGLDKTRVTFDQQRQAAHDFAQSFNLDRKTLDLGKFRRLSGAEIVGLKNVLTRNLNAIGEISKQMADETLSVGDHEQLGETVDKLRGQNDALLTKIVSETSEKGRDLGFLRQLSNSSLDPDAWVITAKRMVGDRMLSDEETATVRRLAKEAADACRGGL